MRDSQVEMLVFGIKQDDASLLVIDFLKIIQQNVDKFLSSKTYADTTLSNIMAI